LTISVAIACEPTIAFVPRIAHIDKRHDASRNFCDCLAPVLALRMVGNAGGSGLAASPLRFYAPSSFVEKA
jgi:hypothetical protein